MWRALLFALLAAQIPIFAQIGPYPGGGYPEPGQYPPGQYPPGQYPGTGGVGLPIPWPRHKKDGQGSSNEILHSTDGKLRSMDGKSVVIEASDGRVLNYKRTDKTKFYKDSKEVQAKLFKTGDKITVEASEDSEGYFYARNVYWKSGAATEAKAPAASPSKQAPPASSSSQKTAQQAPAAPPPGEQPPDVIVQKPADPDPDDPGPPTLRRGVPPKQAKSSEAEEESRPVVTAQARPAPAPAETPQAGERPSAAQQPDSPQQQSAGLASMQPQMSDPLVERARQVAYQFTDKLPNFVCKQYTTRYYSQTQKVEWQPIDVVSAEVVYDGGKESYRNILVNNKPVHKNMMDIGGSRSTGEFGTILLDLFSTSTAADFRPLRNSSADGMTAEIYSFYVGQSTSHWHIEVASQAIQPAYKGSVWIEPKSGRVLRIEMQARKLPGEFPLDTVETAIDYDKVRIGEREFVLPVHAELLSCERGTSNCSRNVIDFRNYQKFGAETNVTFGGER